MANELAKLDKATIDDAQDKIERVVKACDMIKLSELKMLEQAITLSTGIRALKKVMTDQVVSEIFMPLQGSQLGFLTDKDKDSGYPMQVVRNCWIQGFLWGLQPVNNELNIIAEKAYAAKNGLERKVRQAVQDLIIRPGVPVSSGDKTALIPMRAQWTFNGKRCELVKDLSKLNDGLTFDERYAIRVNAGMGPDAIIGKAYRKLYRDILAMLTNNTMNLADGDVIEATGESVIDGPAPAPAPPEHDGKRVHVGKAQPAKPEPATPPPASKSDPTATKAGIQPEEIRAMKKDAKERGDEALVKICEDAMTGDFIAMGKLQEIRDAGTQM